MMQLGIANKHYFNLTKSKRIDSFLFFTVPQLVSNIYLAYMK